jgi:ribonuclease Z
VTIDAYRVNHFPVDPAYGYVLRYQGKKIFVSGDTRVTDIYQDALQDADLVIHEALNTHMIEKIAESMERQGLNQKASDARKVIEYHSDTLELASLAEKAKVKHLVLTHLIPAPPNFIAKYLFVRGMADRFNGEITLGEDALEIDL